MTAAVEPIVVVGGGTAGCTVVSHLAAKTTREIVLVEPGPVSPLDDVPGFFDVIDGGSLTRTREARVVSEGPLLPYVEGRALGGGSAVNAMLLSGEPPEELRGLTREAGTGELGLLGRALLNDGGEPARLWWNAGRWNPGRAVQHLLDEGRVSRVVAEVQSLEQHAGFTVLSGGAHELRASELVLCAGAIGTPSLLMAPGTGAPHHAVGRGLQNHPVVTFTVHKSAETSHQSGVFDAGVLKRGRTAGGRAVLTLAYERASAREPHLGLMSVLLLEVDSRGSVSREDGRLVVDFNCLDVADDRVAMVSAVDQLIQTVTSARFAEDVGVFSADDTGLTVAALARMNPRDLESWIVGHVGVASHASSSCAGAVDGIGRLHGAEGVWIADASVLERVPACTTAAPVTMEARRIARHVAEVVLNRDR